MPKAVSSVDAGQSYMELYHRLHRIVDQAMCSAGLSLARAKVLMRLDAHGPMNQATLAGLLGFAPRSVTETVDGLERDGLVTRTEDPHDRRARIVELTESGHAAVETSTAVRRRDHGRHLRSPHSGRARTARVAALHHSHESQAGR